MIGKRRDFRWSLKNEHDTKNPDYRRQSGLIKIQSTYFRTMQKFNLFSLATE